MIIYKIKHKILLVFLMFYSINSFGQKFALESIFNTPFIYGVTASAKTSDVVFTSVDRGARNVFIAIAPTYKLKKLTSFDEDDGQEITSLSISDDGIWVVFVRGGDHGGNATVRPINPSSLAIAPRIAVYSVHVKSGLIKILGDGDYPKINPMTKQVVFLSDGNVVTAPLDGLQKPQLLFSDRGNARSYKWSPDGKKLLFTSKRESNSFIGVYETSKKNIKWISPSYFTDGFQNGRQMGKR